MSKQIKIIKKYHPVLKVFGDISWAILVKTIKMRHCHMLNMSSFLSTAAIRMSEDSSVVIQYHILCYCPAESSLSLCSARVPTESFVYSLLQVLSRGCSLPLSLCVFCPLPVCLDLRLLSWPWVNWKFSDARMKFMFCVYTAPWSLVLILHTCNSTWYFPRRMSPFLKMGVNIVFYKVSLLA